MNTVRQGETLWPVRFLNPPRQKKRKGKEKRRHEGAYTRYAQRRHILAASRSTPVCIIFFPPISISISHGNLRLSCIEAVRQVIPMKERDVISRDKEAGGGYKREDSAAYLSISARKRDRIPPKSKRRKKVPKKIKHKGREDKHQEKNCQGSTMKSDQKRRPPGISR